MILQISKTYVDEDGADVDIYEVELTDEELTRVRELADGSNWEEPVKFRGRIYEYPQDVLDILDVVGTKIVPDEVVEVYVY
jgi:phage-related protein